MAVQAARGPMLRPIITGGAPSPLLNWTLYASDINWADTSSEIKDTSGNAFHGNAEGMSAANEVANGGLSFSSDRYIHVPAFLPHGPHTISMWFFNSSGLGSNNTAVLVAQRGAGGDYFQAAVVLSSFTVDLRYWNGTSELTHNLGQMATNVWYFLAWTHNGASRLRFYFEDAMVSEKTLALGAASTEPFVYNRSGIAGFTYGRTASWGIKAYDEEFSGAEILALYDEGNPHT